MKRIRVSDLHKKWDEGPRISAGIRSAEGRIRACQAMMEARARAGLMQAQVARRMKTTQTAIARLEGGRMKPSTCTLERYAKATEHRLVIGFEPKKARGGGRKRTVGGVE